MIFDVMVRHGYNEVGKQIISVLRIRDVSLNLYLRRVQCEDKFIIAVIPLFRKKEQSRSEFVTGLNPARAQGLTQLVEESIEEDSMGE